MKISYPSNLPISERKNDIIEAILQHQVTIISGDTGSGKTTQLPKMCLEGLGNPELLIGCTQPRRIAASSVALRVAEELKNPDMVGYKIRFHDHTTVKTRIKFMTDGVLLAESRQDRLLSKYGVIIVDEAHERSLNIDFLLGYLKNLITQRRDLKIIITSATIDTQKFSAHFNDAPIIKVSGRTYPVTVQYQPPLQNGDNEEKDSLFDHCVNTTVELHRTHPKGDILIFLATEKEILECCKQLASKIANASVLPLFGRLSVGDQKKIFLPSKFIKIVVATNVAETSITVPGIRYVIDSGMARISHYNVRAKTTGLPITKISRASCDQRKGRCGRIGPGHCIRLFSEDDFNNRAEYTLPEIKRSNLAEVILQMISLDFGDPEKFPFLEPPFKNALREGYRLLRELGAIDDRLHLTQQGKLMANLPIDPCISRILIEAKNNDCLKEIKIIAAVLAIQDPRVRPVEQQNKADLAHKAFKHPLSDFMVLLNIWNSYHELENAKKSWSKLKKFCRDNFLSFQRMREWFDLHNQLNRILNTTKGFQDNSEEASYDSIHKALMSGFLRNLAVKKQKKIYQGSHNKELMVFPGSQQFKNSGQWVMAATFLETNRLYALTVATIEPEWAEPIGKHLCKYSWSNPHYLKKRGQVVATETVSLFGLTIVAGRQVTYGKQNKKAQQEARDIFINEALVPGELIGTYHFIDHNLRLITNWQGAEDKLRTRNIVADQQVVYDFYNNSLPDHVFDRPSLNRHLKKKKSDKKYLKLRDSDILLRRPETNELVDYPPSCTLGQISVDLEYCFAPGTEEDGITFRLPLDLAITAKPAWFDWLVPGLLHEKLTFLLKGLPKQVRKKLVPISDTVNLLLDEMEFRSGSLSTSLERAILKHFRILVNKSDWPAELPNHLTPRFHLVGNAEKIIASGRDLKKLLQSTNSNQNIDHKPELTQEQLQLRARWEGSEHKDWDFDGLPKVIPILSKTGAVTGFLYPALVQNHDRQCLTVIFTRNKREAENHTFKGNLYLFWLQFAPQYKSLKKYVKTALSGPSAAILSQLGMPRPQIIEFLLDHILFGIIGFSQKEIIEKDLFQLTLRKLKALNLYSNAQRRCDDILALYRKRKYLETSIKSAFGPQLGRKPHLPNKQKHFADTLERVFPIDFFIKPIEVEIFDIDRQLQCLKIRLERFSANPSKDAAKEALLQPFVKKLLELEKQDLQIHEEAKVEFELYKKMVNEYRISIFSPEIKTKISVSPKKLEKQWNATITKC